MIEFKEFISEARITFDSLMHSRTAGMFTISGKGYLEAAKNMLKTKGIEGAEHDAENSQYVMTYNKTMMDQEFIKDLFKKAKKG
jgi:hypothetical protein